MSMRIVYITAGENGAYGLRYLIGLGYKIERVITINEDVARRNVVSGFMDVRELCTKLNVEVIALDKYSVETTHLPDGQLDVLIVNGWNRLVKPEVINRFRNGGLGIHAGHPPIGLGRAPLPWNIIKGFKDIEVYVFRLTPNADDGNIAALQRIEITDHDTVRTLYEKVMFQGAILFKRCLDAIERGDLVDRPQEKDRLVYYQKRSPQDGVVNFSDDVAAVYNFIRAQTRPYPGAFGFMDKTRWSFWHAIPFDDHSFQDSDRIPGRVVAALPSGIVVQTASSPIWILEAEADDGRTIPDSLERMEEYVGQLITHAP